MTARIKSWLQSPYRWVVAVTLLSLLASGLIYQNSLRQEKARLQAHFEHLANDRALRFQNELDQTLTVLVTLHGVFSTRAEVRRNEFQLMVAPVLKRHPEIMAVNWAPLVRQSERAQFERRLLAEGLGDDVHGIFEVSSDARDPHKANIRPRYFPVLFSEPSSRNRRAVGIDPYARPENQAAMDAAARHGALWSTQSFALMQDPQGPAAIAVYQPVYRSGAAKRAAALRGYLILVLRPAMSLENTLRTLSPVGLDTRLLDISAGNQLIHRHSSRIPPADIRPGEALRRSYPLKMPGRTWMLQITASEGFYVRAGSHETLVALVSGLLISLLFSLIVWANIRQNLRQTKLAKELLESENRFRQLAENIHAVFWIGTPDWQHVLYISPAYQRVWGRSVGSLYTNGMDWFNAILEEDQAAVLAKIPAGANADWLTLEFPPYRIRRPDGSLCWISAQAYPIRDDAGKIVRVAGIAEDISERQSYQQHLEELAHFDPLTHLPNRRLLADRMRLALARSQRTGQLLAICMLDLDGFKPVNDKFGHEVGDQLLIEVAQRLQDSVRGDDTVARLGGDEFILLLGGLGSVKELEETLRRVLHLLAAPYPLSEHSITISASIGVTRYPSDYSDADTLLRHADHAMYLAKEAGKNRYILFNPLQIERERPVAPVPSVR